TIACTAILGVVLTGCESVSTALETTNAVLGATNSVLGAATGTSSSSSSRSSSSYSRSPRPTAEQQLKIDNLAFKASNAQIQRAIAEAKPNIQKMLRMTSCFNADGLKVIGTSDSTYSLNNPGSIGDFRYHPKDKCLDVVRVFGWKMPARNALEFYVVYSSEISGETYKAHIEMRHEDGEWLVRGHW
ncbi:MAG: hypothetical protein IKH45_03750, partial [Neisseriaceae bacterium]|nr:hypothetical protein [Neisseriaceae bacterium]